MPNDDTPARRTWAASRGHARACCSSDRPLPSHSIWLLGCSACSDFGKTSCRSASTIFITPRTPAAAWACPRFDFDDPSHSGRSSRRVGPNTAAKAPASMGSPRLVPVPCASTTSMSSGLTPLADKAARITRCWLGPFGAVRPWLRPSWFTADPRISAKISSPSRSASDWRFSTSTPQPSLQPAPSAPSAKLLLRPSGATARNRLNSTNTDGVLITCTPPASARSHSP